MAASIVAPINELLPDEILLNVFLFAREPAVSRHTTRVFRALLYLAGVCQRWRRVAKDPSLWERVEAQTKRTIVLLAHGYPATIILPSIDEPHSEDVVRATWLPWIPRVDGRVDDLWQRSLRLTDVRTQGTHYTPSDDQVSTLKGYAFFPQLKPRQPHARLPATRFLAMLERLACDFQPAVLESLRSMPLLRQLRLGAVPYASLGTLFSVIVTSTAPLEALDLHTNPTTWDAANCAAFVSDAGPCTTLRRLSLTAHIDSKDLMASFAAVAPNITHLRLNHYALSSTLGGIFFRHLRHLTTGFGNRDPYDYTAFPLDLALESLTMPWLCTFPKEAMIDRVTVSSDLDTESLRRLLNALPRRVRWLHLEGIVEAFARHVTKELVPWWEVRSVTELGWSRRPLITMWRCAEA